MNCLKNNTIFFNFTPSFSLFSFLRKFFVKSRERNRKFLQTENWFFDAISDKTVNLLKTN